MNVTGFDTNRPNFAPYGFTCRRRQASRMPRPDRHNEIELNLLESGSLTYLIGGRRVRLIAGQLYVFWATMPHQILDYAGVENFLVATIPLAWILEWRLPGKLTRPLLRGEVLRNAESDYAAEDLMMLSRWVDYMDSAPSDLQEIILLEIHARLLRFAHSKTAVLSDSASARGKSANSSELSKAERLACFIAQNCTQNLSAQDMGRAVDLHPNYAMSVFKKTFGITLNEYLTRQRISHAQRLLVTSEAKIAHIALSSGFTSISRFNAAFHAICHNSPSQYRIHNRIGR
jgi:AraC-like DNA-binding protein